MSLGDIVGDLLGGQGGSRNAVVSALLASINSRPGGIGGLIDKFHAAGAGHVIDSWIGTGENLPVSPGTLEKVFGGDELHALAGQSGVAPEQATGILAQILPHVISGATPNGKLPVTGQLDASNVLNAVSQIFGH
ncbi:MAG TPA: YidB family protein [Pseudonocardiaceae bacterium]|nr:YidB family protein [Pseudonocardiaceae bacterium]